MHNGTQIPIFEAASVRLYTGNSENRYLRSAHPSHDGGLRRHEVRLESSNSQGCGTDGLSVCRPEKEKSSKRTWEVTENKNTMTNTEPGKYLKNPGKYPKKTQRTPRKTQKLPEPHVLKIPMALDVLTAAMSSKKSAVTGYFTRIDLVLVSVKLRRRKALCQRFQRRAPTLAQPNWADRIQL